MEGKMDQMRSVRSQPAVSRPWGLPVQCAWPTHP